VAIPPRLKNDSPPPSQGGGAPIERQTLPAPSSGWRRGLGGHFESTNSKPDHRPPENRPPKEVLPHSESVFFLEAPVSPAPGKPPHLEPAARGKSKPEQAFPKPLWANLQGPPQNPKAKGLRPIPMAAKKPQSFSKTFNEGSWGGPPGPVPNPSSSNAPFFIASDKGEAPKWVQNFHGGSLGPQQNPSPPKPPIFAQQTPRSLEWEIWGALTGLPCGPPWKGGRGRGPGVSVHDPTARAGQKKGARSPREAPLCAVRGPPLPSPGFSPAPEVLPRGPFPAMGAPQIPPGFKSQRPLLSPSGFYSPPNLLQSKPAPRNPPPIWKSRLFSKRPPAPSSRWAWLGKCPATRHSSALGRRPGLFRIWFGPHGRPPEWGPERPPGSFGKSFPALGALKGKPTIIPHGKSVEPVPMPPIEDSPPGGPWGAGTSKLKGEAPKHAPQKILLGGFGWGPITRAPQNGPGFDFNLQS